MPARTRPVCVAPVTFVDGWLDTLTRDGGVPPPIPPGVRGVGLGSAENSSALLMSFRVVSFPFDGFGFGPLDWPRLGSIGPDGLASLGAAAEGCRSVVVVVLCARACSGVGVLGRPCARA